MKDKAAFYKIKIGLIKITYEKKIKSISLVDEIHQKNEPTDLTNKIFFQIDQYLDKKRENFDLYDDLDIVGTDFQLRVWKSLRKIPYGQTRTYKEIAQDIAKPKAYRPVGSAIGKNPFFILIPCHRVLGSDGKLTGFAYGVDIKRKLLEIEGII